MILECFLHTQMDPQTNALALDKIYAIWLDHNHTRFNEILQQYLKKHPVIIKTTTMQSMIPEHAALVISTVSQWFVSKRTGTLRGSKVLPLFGTRSQAAVVHAAKFCPIQCKITDLLRVGSRAVKALLTSQVTLIIKVLPVQTLPNQPHI